tara:strand:+ start:102 stop:317 length:216 start_codon:yes stop_codon:yes gene_type:complete
MTVKQLYKIELIVKTDVENNPRTWIKFFEDLGYNPLKAISDFIKVYSYSVEPIDMDMEEKDYKFIEDMDKH